MELLKQVLGQEGEQRVLGGADGVVGEGLVGVDLARSHHMIWHHQSRPPFLGALRWTRWQKVDVRAVLGDYPPQAPPLSSLRACKVWFYLDVKWLIDCDV